MSSNATGRLLILASITLCTVMWLEKAYIAKADDSSQATTTKKTHSNLTGQGMSTSAPTTGKITNNTTKKTNALITTPKANKINSTTKKTAGTTTTTPIQISNKTLTPTNMTNLNITKGNNNNDTNSVPKCEDSLLPVVINTWPFRKANIAAWNVLNNTKSGSTNGTLAAVVEGCTVCEQLQCDGTVGYGGSPDETGETTLDAMIMDGATMNIGAVAGMRRIKNAIGVARHVLENTRHTLIVGDAATKFASLMGFKEESLSTNVSQKMWEQWRAGNCQPNFWSNVYPDSSLSCGPYKPKPSVISPWQQERSRYEYKIGSGNHDTIGMIAIDANGQIHAGTSTNGARNKIPGRVGDSPIPGAGAYADNDVGAAVATGDGDIMMRFLPSLLAVEAMRAGKTPTEAADMAMRRIVNRHSDFSGALVVIDKWGNYSAACVGMDEFPYTVSNRKSTQTGRIEYKKCIPTADVHKTEIVDVVRQDGLP